MEMNRVIATGIKDPVDRETERTLVHYDGPSLVGWQTLCGHVDRSDYTWISTTRRANCPGCLDVRKHVTGR